MPLEAGRKLGPYEIVEPIGKGGMGEVYRARDTKLDRDVAIKVLPDEFAHDEERLARFEREAKLLASLNHPNIASIYGFESNALVLELVEGPTLAERVEQGSIPVEEAVAIAKQIAEALEAGHEAGVIHRDLKPANVKVKVDGTVKVLDYGLAKALEGDALDGPDSELSQSPTLTRQGTQVGVILGTAAYMSPEQAKGKRVDKRTDIWAFGAVLYEMLTGNRAFGGDDVSETLARVLMKEPDWASIPVDAPPTLVQALRVCLTKDIKLRAHDIADVRLAIDGAFETTREAAADAPRSTGFRALPAVAAAFALGVVIAAIAAYSVTPETTQPVARLSMLAPPEIERFSSVQFAVSPNGRNLAFVAISTNGRHIGVRPIDSMESRMLAGTEGAQFPFWSPDSQFIGYFSDGKLKRVQASGGPSATLWDLENSRGGSWNHDAVILVGSNEGILRVEPGGGTPSLITTVDETRGENEHAHPQFLPDNKHFLFLARTGEEDSDGIYVGSLDSSETKRVLDAHFKPLYARAGYLLSVSQDELWAWPFDTDALEVSETAFPLAENVRTNEGNAGFGVSVSDSGTLVFHKNRRSVLEALLVWSSPGGSHETIIDEPLRYPGGLRLSPDGRNLAVTVDSRDGGELWVYPVDGRPAYPLAPDINATHPVWSPDGARIAFGSGPQRQRGLDWVPADGSGLSPNPVSSTLGWTLPGSWSRDGKELIVDRPFRGVFVVPLEGEREARLVVETKQLSEGAPRLSPNGSLLAYVSAATGRREIWVRPYPGSGAPVRVTANGGADPVWSRDGEILYYLEGALGTPNVRLMGVRVATGPEIGFDAPQMFVDGGFVTDSRDRGAYDVAADGRFVMLRSTAAETDMEPERDQLVVVLNWYEELKRLVAATE